MRLFLTLGVLLAGLLVPLAAEIMPCLFWAYDEWTRLLPNTKGWLDHPARVYLVDPKGNIREIYSLAFFNEKQALIDMRVLLAEK